MSALALTAPRVVAAGRLLAPGTVVVDGGRVAEVRAGAHPAATVLEHGVLAPGLVDLQVNGGFGIDLNRGEPDEWVALAARLPETGVTAFLPTLVSAPVPRLAALLRSVQPTLAARPATAARMLGVHLEGPFLAPTRAGAHDPAALTTPTPAAVDALLASGALAALTLAPELPGALAAVARLARAGVLVGVGHSDARAAEVAAAAGAGARMVTHLFNAQRGLHHREPGVAGQGLADPRLACGLILDGHHVADAVARIAFAAAPGRIALVTDATAAAGMPPGRYELAGRPVTVCGLGAPPVGEDGALAGSALRLDEAVARAVALGVDLVAAVDAASRVPADLLGRPDLGRIAPGTPADLVWLGDDGRARATWIAGRRVPTSA